MEDRLLSLGSSHDAVALFSQNKTNSTQHLKQKEMKLSRIFLFHSLNEKIVSFLSARELEMGGKMLSLHN